jgi:hypothetical protein
LLHGSARAALIAAASFLNVDAKPRTAWFLSTHVSERLIEAPTDTEQFSHALEEKDHKIALLELPSERARSIDTGHLLRTSAGCSSINSTRLASRTRLTRLGQRVGATFPTSRTHLQTQVPKKPRNFLNRLADLRGSYALMIVILYVAKMPDLGSRILLKMTEYNPYAPPTLAHQGRAIINRIPVVRRMLWSAGCLAIGVGLSWGVPILLIYLGLWKSKGDLSGLFILYICYFASIVSGLVGMVSGAQSPGRYGVLVTMACVVLTNFIAFPFCSGRYASSNAQFVLLYLVSAFVTVLGMKAVVPRNERLLNHLANISGAILLLCIAGWLAR